MEPLRQPPAACAHRREAHLAAAHKVRPEEGHAFAHEALDRGIGLRIRSRARVRDERVLELGQPRAWGLPPFPVLSARPIVVDQRGGGPRDSGGERPVKSLPDGAPIYPVCHARHKLVGCRNGSGHGPRLHRWCERLRSRNPASSRSASSGRRGRASSEHAALGRSIRPALPSRSARSARRPAAGSNRAGTLGTSY